MLSSATVYQHSSCNLSAKLNLTSLKVGKRKQKKSFFYQKNLYYLTTRLTESLVAQTEIKNIQSNNKEYFFIYYLQSDFNFFFSIHILINSSTTYF